MLTRRRFFVEEGAQVSGPLHYLHNDFQMVGADLRVRPNGRTHGCAPTKGLSGKASGYRICPLTKLPSDK